jgi:hypothetical protein
LNPVEKTSSNLRSSVTVFTCSTRGDDFTKVHGSMTRYYLGQVLERKIGFSSVVAGGRASNIARCGGPPCFAGQKEGTEYFAAVTRSRLRTWFPPEKDGFRSEHNLWCVASCPQTRASTRSLLSIATDARRRPMLQCTSEAVRRRGCFLMRTSTSASSVAVEWSD